MLFTWVAAYRFALIFRALLNNIDNLTKHFFVSYVVRQLIMGARLKVKPCRAEQHYNENERLYTFTQPPRLSSR